MSSTDGGLICWLALLAAANASLQINRTLSAISYLARPVFSSRPSDPLLALLLRKMRSSVVYARICLEVTFPGHANLDSHRFQLFVVYTWLPRTAMPLLCWFSRIFAISYFVIHFIISSISSLICHSPNWQCHNSFLTFDVQISFILFHWPLSLSVFVSL